MLLIHQQFCDKGGFVSDGKSDGESDWHPNCMQIGQRIGYKNVRVDGPWQKMEMPRGDIKTAKVLNLWADSSIGEFICNDIFAKAVR
jgi:hypothetical protein